MEYCIFVEPQAGATWPELTAIAQSADRLGFDGFFRSDHLINADGSFVGSPAVSDAWTTLAGLARDTTRIRLGTLVSPVTFRHPGALAVQVANVDAMSEGRVELGLGAGWNQPEHDAYGIPFPRKRFGMFEEQLEIITGLWTTPPGELFRYEGEHYRLTGAPGAQRPFGTKIPIIIGGSGAERTPALAARFADEFNANFASNEVIAERYARARSAADAIGRDPATLRLSTALTATVGASDKEADRRAETLGRDLDQQREQGLHGSPPAIAGRIAELAALGCGRVYFQLLDPRDLEQVELLAEAVRLSA